MSSLTNSKESNDITLIEIIEYLKKYFNILKQKWLMLMFIGLIGFSLGFGYSFFFKTVKYQADLTFAVEENSVGTSSVSGALGLASSLGLDISGGGNSMFASTNLLELFKSKKVIVNALLRNMSSSRLTYIDYFIQKTIEGKPFKSFVNENKISFEGYIVGNNVAVDSILNMVHRNLIANSLVIKQIDKKISIIKVTTLFTDQLFAKEFNLNLVEEVSNFYIQTKSKKAKQNVDILEKQVDSIRNELNNAITGVALANDNAFNLNQALNIKRIPSTKRQIDVQANTAILTELVKNLELGRLSLRKETPLIQIIDRPYFPLERIGQQKISTGLKLATLFLGIYVFWLIGYSYFEAIKTTK